VAFDWKEARAGQVAECVGLLASSSIMQLGSILGMWRSVNNSPLQWENFMYAVGFHPASRICSSVYCLLLCSWPRMQGVVSRHTRTCHCLPACHCLHAMPRPMRLLTSFEIDAHPLTKSSICGPPRPVQRGEHANGRRESTFFLGPSNITAATISGVTGRRKLHVGKR
jgi:hypothetical protein